MFSSHFACPFVTAHQVFDLSLEQVEQKVDNNQLTKQTNEVITISALGSVLLAFLAIGL